MTSTPSSETAAVGGHTPGPWVVHPTMAWVTSAAKPDDAPICELCVSSYGIDRKDEAKANAALIVRAVNSHAALVEMVGHFLRCQDEGDGLYDCVDNFEQRYQSADLASVIERARDLLAALASAEAGK